MCSGPRTSTGAWLQTTSACDLGLWVRNRLSRGPGLLEGPPLGRQSLGWDPDTKALVSPFLVPGCTLTTFVCFLQCPVQLALHLLP